MAAVQSVPVEDRREWVPTGALELDEFETCRCERLLVIDGAHVCPECSTCYGVVMNDYRGLRRSAYLRWRRRELRMAE